MIATAIKFMVKFKSVSGPKKKDAVLRAVTEAIETSDNIEDSEKDNIHQLIELFGEQTLDALISFAEDSVTFLKKKRFNCKCPASCKKSTSSREIDNGVYDTLKDYITLKLQHPVTAPKIIVLVAAGVKFIEQYKSMTGAEKKKLVIQVVRDVITESTLIDDEARKEILLYLDMFADDMIDYLVDFGKHMYLKIKTNGYCRGGGCRS
jgi:hypothetical protein